MGIRMHGDNSVIILTQSGRGIPVHISPKATLYFDIDTAIVYINKDGLNTWEPLNVAISGFTYNSLNNTLTITDSSGRIFNAYINEMSGLTVNGLLKSQTISGVTLSADTIINKELNLLTSTGVYDFSGITKTSNTTFKIAPAKGIITDDIANPSQPKVTYVNYSGATGLTTPYLTTNTITYILLNSGSTITLQPNVPTPQQRRQNIYLGKIGHPDKANLSIAFQLTDYVQSPTSQLRDMFTPIPLINGGIYPYPNGANLSFNNTAGTLWGLGISYPTSLLNPNSISISGNSPVTFQYRTQTGGTLTATTIIEPQYWDNGGVRTLVGSPAKQATNQRIYILQDGSFRMQYGQTVYADLATALQNVQTETFTTFPNFRDNGILIGILSIASDTVDLSDSTHAKFLLVSKFGETIGASGGLSTTNLQQAYNNSTEPEILTNSTLEGLTIRRGSASDNDFLIQFQNGAGTTRASIDATGLGNFTNIQITGLTSSANTRFLVANSDGTVTYRTDVGIFDVFVTGGSYNSLSGIASFTNNTGGTFNVTGFNTAVITGFTPSNYVAQGKLNANQSIPNGSDTVIQFIDDFDPQNWWSPSTYKLTPNIAGYYIIDLGGWFDDMLVTSGQANIQARINGSTFAIQQAGLYSGTGLGLGLTKVIYMNGTTDYLDFTIYQSSGGAKNLLQGTSIGSGTWFSATLIASGPKSFDTFVTGGTYSNGNTTFYNNSGGTFTVTGFTANAATGGTYSNGTITLAGTGTLSSITGLTTPFSGGTVTGATLFNNGLSANTFSAATYLNLPTDIRVTGGTYSNGNATFTNNTGGTFNVTGFTANAATGGTYSNGTITLAGTGILGSITGLTTPFTGGTVTGSTLFNNGLSANTISATTYLNLPVDITITGGTYSNSIATFTNNTGGTFNVTGFTTPFTGGTVTGATLFNNGLTANTISATTYLNLPTDIRVTGGTYSNGTTTFTNNTGGTFNVVGFYTGATDVFVTGGTYTAGTVNFTNNTGGTFTVSGFTSLTPTTLYTGNGYLLSNRIIGSSGYSLTFSSVTPTVFQSNGNLTIGTSVDTGFKLDVLGDTRVDKLTVSGDTIYYGPETGKNLGALIITQKTTYPDNYGIFIGPRNSGTEYTSTTTSYVFGGTNIINGFNNNVFGFGNSIFTGSSSDIIFGSGNLVSGGTAQIIIGANNTIDSYTNGQISGIIIGRGNNTNTFYGGGLIGSSLKYYANRQLAFGSNSGNVDLHIEDVYFGYGVKNEWIPTDNSGQVGHGPNISINPSWASTNGFNKNGGNITIAGGRGTGTGTTGDIIFSTPNTGVSGSTLQALQQRFWIKGSSGNVGNISSPTNKLHITASTDPVRFVGIQSSTDSTVLSIDSSGIVHTISVSAITAPASANTYTTGATLSGSTLVFNRNDLSNAYNVNLSALTPVTLYTGNGLLTSNRIVGLNSYSLTISGTTSSRFHNSGNVSIGGTADTGDKLYVKGNISVDTSGIPVLISSYNPVGSIGYNIFIGNGGLSSVSGTSNASSYNTALGYNALLTNNSGKTNTAVGYNTLYFNTDGYSNVALGTYALQNNTIGYNNVGIGVTTLVNNTIGYSNTAIGGGAMWNQISGNTNVAIGSESMYSNINGISNIGIGVGAYRYATGGLRNIAIGELSLANITNDNNIGIGYFAGYYNIFGGTNTASTTSMYLGISSRAGSTASTNEIVIGYQAYGNGSNTVTLGNTSILSTILQGNVGMGPTAPTNKLHITAATDPIKVVGLQNASDSTLVSVDASGVFHTRTVSAITASTPTLYTSDGTIINNRVVNLSAYTLNFSSSTYPNVLSLNAGNVIVGGVSSTYKFDVNGRARINNNLYISGKTFIDPTSAYTDYGAYLHIFQTGTTAESSIVDYIRLQSSAHSVAGMTLGIVAYGGFIRYYSGGGFRFTNGTATTMNITAYPTNAGAITIAGSGGTENYVDFLGGIAGNGYKVFIPRGIWSYNHTSYPFQAIKFNGYANNQGVTLNGYSAPDAVTLFGDTGNLAINTITDNGYRLNVNGNVYINSTANTLTIVGLQSASDNKVLSIDATGGVHTISVSAITASTSANTYTTGATLSGSTLVFNRNDLSNAYNVNLSALTPVTLYTGNGTISSNRGVNLSSFYLDISGTTPTRFFSDGNVAIGTTSNNGYKLNVLGKLGTTYSSQSAFISTYFDTATLGGNLFIGNGGQFSSIGLYVTDGSTNTSVGIGALYTNTTGKANTVVGNNSMYNNISGFYNVAIGGGAMYFNTSGDSNVAVGTNALYKNLIGGSNTAVGQGALGYMTGGSNNLALGYFSLSTTGNVSSQIALGDYTLTKITAGTRNIVIGGDSLRDLISGNESISIGFRTLYTTKTSNYNIAIGSYAGAGTVDSLVNANPTNSVFIGHGTLAATTADTNQVVIGYQAYGYGSNSVSIGSTSITKTILQGNVGMGPTAPTNKLHITAATDPVRFVGLQNASDNILVTVSSTGVLHTTPLSSVTSVASANTFTTGATLSGTTIYFNRNDALSAYSISLSALSVTANTLYTGDGVILSNRNVGLSSFSLTISGTTSTRFHSNGNVSIGATGDSGQKLYVRGNISVDTNGQPALISTYYDVSNSGVGKNVFIGGGGLNSSSSAGTTYGSYNTSLGVDALKSNTLGNYNTAIGINALNNNISGFSNTALGVSVLQSNTFGIANVGVGISNLQNNTTGSYNTAIGQNALMYNITGSSNVAIGYYALGGSNYTGGSNNIAIGDSTLLNTSTGIRNISIGSEALRKNNIGSYNLALGYRALYENISGTSNIAIGSFAGNIAADSSANVLSIGGIYIGDSATPSSSAATNEIVIGNSAVSYGSNSVTLGNTSILKTILQGNVGMGPTAPTNKLHITAATDPVKVVGLQNSNTDNILVSVDTNGVLHTRAVSAITASTPTLYTSNGTLLSNRVVDITGNTLNFSSSTYPNVLSLNSGNVIVGGISSTYKFDVNGSSRIQGNLILLDSSVRTTMSAETQANSKVFVINSTGAGGGFNGGFDFRAGSGGRDTGTTIFKIWATNDGSGNDGKVGIGNLTESNLQSSSSKLYIDNTFYGGRNAAIRITPNSASTTEYNGIQFDYNNKDSYGGVFIGSQYNPLANGYDTDLVVLGTSALLTSYNEIARFVGKYQSLFVGTGRTNAVASAKLQVDSTNQGVLTPRMSSTNRTSIVSPATGLLVYQTGGTEGQYVKLSSQWARLLTEIDVTGFTNTFTTGATYNVTAGTFTFTTNSGNTYTAGTLNYVTGGTQVGNTLTLRENDGGTVIYTANAVTGGSFSNGTLILSGTGSISNITGLTSADTYTTAATFTNNTIYFNRNNGLSAYSVSLSALSVTANTLYTGDGVILSNRNVGLSSFSLTISGTTSSRFHSNGNVTIGATGDSGQKLYVRGNISVDTNGQSALISTYYDTIGLGKNIFIGNGGLSSVSNTGFTYYGSLNTSVGYDSLKFNTVGNYNTAIGVNALYLNTSGGSNTALGATALQNNTTGNFNTGVGSFALLNNTSGTTNTAIGASAMRYNVSGSSNIAIGDSALGSTVYAASENIGIGSNTLSRQLTGTKNIAIGTETLKLNEVGSYNVNIGYRSFFYSLSGTNNIGIGNFAGSNSNDGKNNINSSYSIYIGDSTRSSTSAATNEIAIGYQTIGTGSNTVILGNPSITATTLQGNVGVGTSAPTNKLHVTATTNPVRVQGLQSASDNQLVTVDSTGVLHTFALSAVTAFTSANTFTTAATYNVTAGTFTFTTNSGTTYTAGTLNYVTGGTQVGNTFTLTENDGGTVIYTANAVTGGSFSNGTLILSGTGSLSNITGLPTQFTGGTVTGGTRFTNGLTANTISATTYLNLPIDVFVTGGSYNGLSGVASFTNSTGGTFNVSGFNTAVITGFTPSNYVAQGKLNANQSIPNGSDAVIQFVDDFDPQNWWNPSTYKLTPNIAGYYIIDLGGWFEDPLVTTGQANIQARINGSTFAINQSSLYSGTGVGLGLTKVIYMNGTTDYLDFTIYQSSGGARNLLQGTSIGSGTWFSATLIASGPKSFDTFITGGTYSNGNATFYNNSGGTFTVTGFTANAATGGTYSNGTITLAGTGTLSTITGLISANTFTTGATYNTSAGTFTFTTNSGSTYTAGTLSYITGNTQSGNTLNLIRNNNTTTTYTPNAVTGGSYSNGTLILSGTGTIANISGLISANTFTTGATYNVTAGTFTFTTNSGNTYTAGTLSYVTGGTQVGNTLTLRENDGGTTIYTANAVTGGSFSNGTLILSGTGVISNISGLATQFTGGTINGATVFNNGLSANTFSATTYLNLPIDVRVTGGTYSNGITTFTNNTGGTFNVTGFTTPFTGGTVTGATLFNSGLSANTFSATTYLNLPKDIFVTGGTHTNGSIAFKNNSGGTFNVTGLTYNAATGGTYSNGTITLLGTGVLSSITGLTSANTFTTGATLIGATVYFNRNDALSAYSVNLSALTGAPATNTFTTGATYNVTAGTFTFTRNDNFTYTAGSLSYVTGGTQVGNTLTLRENDGGTTIYTANAVTGGSFSNGTLILSGTGVISNITGLTSTFTGGTVSGATLFNNGLSANTFSATTYLNLPIDIRVTGGTYSNSIATFTNNTGGTFNVTGFTTPFTGGTVTGATLFNNGLSANTISATTYLNLPLDIRVTGGTYANSVATFTNNTGGTFNVTGFTTPFTGGTVTGATLFNNGLSANTISATTYLNLPIDVRVTGGTYSNGTTTFTNNTGGTFNVTGFTTPFTGGTVTGSTLFNNGLSANTISATTYLNLPLDIRVTGGTYSNSIATFTNNTGGTFNVTGFTTPFTGGTVTGATLFNNGLSANTFSATTYLNLPRDIFVTGGTYNGLSGVASFTNSSGGTFNVTGFNTAVITGFTPSNYVVQGRLNANQSITGSGVDTIIQFIDDFDPQNWWDSSTYKFTPNIAGYYIIDFGVWWEAFSTSVGQCNVQVLKNGFGNTMFINQSPLETATGNSLVGTKIIYMNGTTDYLQFSVFQDSGTNKVIQQGGTNGSGTWFSASLIASGPKSFDTFVTGGTYSNGNATFYNNSGNSFTVTGFTANAATGGTYSNGTITLAGTGILGSITGLTTPFTGGTVTGATLFNNGLSANTFSATTYLNLPLDIRVTGGTYLNSIATFTNNTGGTFNVTGFTTPFTGGTVTGATLFNNGLSANTFSATTYLNLPVDIRVTGGSYSNSVATFTNNTGGTFNVTGFTTPFTGGSVTGATVFNNGLSANTFSATTYLNLPVDVRVTGGTYSNGTTTFTNNTGGTFNVTGFTTPFTGGSVTGATLFNNGLSANTFSATTYLNLPIDVRVTGGTYSNSIATFTNNTGGTFNVTGFTTPFTGGTVTGATLFNSGLSANTFSATTYLNLPIDVRVTGGTYSNGTTTFTNNTGGTFNVTGFTANAATGGTYSNGTITLSGTGALGNITGLISANTFTTGATLSGTTIYFNRNDALSAYSVSLSALSVTANTIYTGDGNLSGNRTVNLGSNTLNFSSTTNSSNLILSGGSVGINTATPSGAAALEIVSITKGVLFPRMTESQRMAINAVTGLIVYQTDSDEGLYIYKSYGWVQII